MGECDTNAGIIFRHNQAYSGIILAYSAPCVTVVYLEPSQIANQRHTQNPGIFRRLAYSEPCQISTMELFAKIVANGYNYIRK